MKQTELKALDENIITLAKEYGPIGVRGLFYKAETAGFVEKTDAACDLVERRTKMLRIDGRLDWDLIIDVSREVKSVSTWDSPDELIRAAHRQFKLDLWANQEYRVQVWIEKVGLLALLEDIIETYRVPVYPGKGYSGLSFIREAALEAIDWTDDGHMVVVLQWGDYDPSGVDIADSLEASYEMFGAGVQFRRVGINKEHIDSMNLSTRPTKKTDTRAKNFNDDRSVELDAVSPNDFKQWVETEVRRYIDFEKWNAGLERETIERRKIIAGIANN